MTEWQQFVNNQQRLGVTAPNVVASNLSDDAARFVAEVESIEL